MRELGLLIFFLFIGKSSVSIVLKGYVKQLIEWNDGQHLFFNTIVVSS